MSVDTRGDTLGRGLDCRFGCHRPREGRCFCLDLAGEHLAFPSSATLSSTPPCIISARWELIRGSEVSTSIVGNTTVASMTAASLALRFSASASFCCSSFCFCSASRFFFSSRRLRQVVSNCCWRAISAAFFSHYRHA